MVAPNLIQTSGLKGLWLSSDVASADGTALASWPSQIDATGELIQTTASAKSTYRTNQLNGHGAVEFITDDFMTADGLAPLFAGSDMPFTLAMVSNAVISGTSIVANFGNTADTNSFHYMGLSSGGLQTTARRGSTADTQTTLTGSGVTIGSRIRIWRFTGTAASMLADNYATLGTTALDKLAFSANQFTVGAFRRNLTIASFSNVRIFEMALWNLALSDDEIAQLSNYWNQWYFARA
jgi:hypothetical protein